MSTHDPADRPLCSAGEADELRQEGLRDLGLMLVGIAHELNTPLGVVISGCDGMRRCHQKLREVVDKPTLDAADHERLRAIVDHLASGEPVLTVGLQRMEALVRELRLRGRSPDAPPLEPVSLVEILEGDLLLLHFQLKQGVTVERRFESQPRVMAHGVFLGQVFLNLLRNAIQAMDGDGTVTVTVRERDGQAEVVIADTGPGIPDAVMAQLFRDNVTTKCPQEGTGIGLLNSRRIVEKHGGRITAANHPDGGAVFTVTLPLA